MTERDSLRTSVCDGTVDWTTGCLVHKYVDDTTLSEVLQPDANNSNMKDFMEDLLSWADQSHMQLNTTKTKEMILGRLSRSQLPILLSLIHI